MGSEPVLLQTDSRGRIALGKLGNAGHYLARTDPSGRIVLEPAVVRTQTEDRLLRDPEFIARMTRAATEPVSDLDLDQL